MARTSSIISFTLVLSLPGSELNMKLSRQASQPWLIRSCSMTAYPSAICLVTIEVFLLLRYMLLYASATMSLRVSAMTNSGI